MKAFWTSHRDTILAAVISVVFGAASGLVSGLKVTEEKVNTLTGLVAVLEQRADDAKDDIDKLQENSASVIRLGNRFESLKDRVDLAETRTAAIKELTELQRQKTINELEELLQKYGRGDLPVSTR